jgi:hypothetical protein
MLTIVTNSNIILQLIEANKKENITERKKKKKVTKYEGNKLYKNQEEKN